MRASQRAAALLYLAILAFALTGCIERTPPPPRPSEPIGAIWGPHVAAQTFRSRELPLTGIEVQLATYARVNEGTVTVRLRREAGAQELRSASVMAADVADNAMHRFSFAPIGPVDASDGQPTWTFTVESTASSQDDAITVWASASDVVRGGFASYDGQARDIDLVFVPVYVEPYPSAIGAQVKRLRSTGPEALAPLALVFLPGLLLAQLFLSRKAHGFGLQLAAAPAFGLAAAPLLILYTTLAGLRLTAPAVLVLMALSAITLASIEVVRLRRSSGQSASPLRRVARRHDWSVGIALLVMLAGLLLRGIALEDGPIPPGADTYHHGVIAQLIADRGQIPDSYRPYAEIDSFSYHFGFHALAGLVALATGEGGIPAVYATALLVSVLPALSAFFLVRSAGLGRMAAITAAVVLALIDPFPVALFDIGRYPQEAALTIFPVALVFGLGYTLETSVAPTRLGLVRAIGGVAVLGAGLFLTHYRVIVYLAIVLAIGTGWAVVRAARADPRLVWPAARLPLASAAVALVLCIPWLFRLAQGFSLGLRGSEGRYAPAYYAIDRLGSVLTHPAVPMLVGLAVLGLALSVITRQRLVALLEAAFLLQLGFSNPHWLPLPGAGWVDTVTVLSSAFVAVAIVIGFLVGRVNHLLIPLVGRFATFGVALAIAGAALWGGLRLPDVVDPGHRLVQDADLVAAGWIREQLPPDARFLVNAFVLRWNPDFVAPTDAGYFLPLLAARQTTLLPMVYPAERGVSPGAIERMEAIARATADDPTSSEALALLRGAGVTHVYFGVRRGPIDEFKIERSPVFRRIYQEGGVSIYELFPGRTP